MLTVCVAFISVCFLKVFELMMYSTTSETSSAGHENDQNLLALVIKGIVKTRKVRNRFQTDAAYKTTQNVHAPI